MGDIANPTDLAWHRRHGEKPWPPWLRGFRKPQLDAAQQIVDAYEHGAEVVLLDAPTGSGKTLIAEMVRRLLGERSVYVCTTKTLQDQVLQDYGYAQVLKGRGNYPTQRRRDLTAADCTGRDCMWCDDPQMFNCPYRNAKRRALAAPIGVLNTSYAILEWNHVGGFSGRGFVVVDEADLLEGLLLRHEELRVTERQRQALEVEELKKGTQAKTVAAWLQQVAEAAETAANKIISTEPEVLRQKQTWERLAVRSGQVAEQIREEWGVWVRDYDERAALILKPTRVDDVAGELLWQHGQRWLLMSGSFVSCQEQALSLGLEREGIPWERVSVPMTFPPENRRIYLMGVAHVTRSEGSKAERKVAEAVKWLVKTGPYRRVLVHAVSYKLTRVIVGELLSGRPRGVRRGLQPPQQGDGMEVLWYFEADERQRALDGFTRAGDENGKRVLVAPSLDRGVDLPGELCDAVIVAKLPYPSLGDKQVAARLYENGGRVWYAVQVARSLLQMTGRGVRSEDDQCDTYILDKEFETWWRSSGRDLMPRWWKEALR